MLFGMLPQVRFTHVHLVLQSGWEKYEVFKARVCTKSESLSLNILRSFADKLWYIAMSFVISTWTLKVNFNVFFHSSPPFRVLKLNGKEQRSLLNAASHVNWVSFAMKTTAEGPFNPQRRDSLTLKTGQYGEIWYFDHFSLNYALIQRRQAFSSLIDHHFRSFWLTISDIFLRVLFSGILLSIKEKSSSFHTVNTSGKSAFWEKVFRRR